MKKTRLIPMILMISFLILAAGCGGGDTGEDPESTLADAAASMAALDGYQFQLSHAGPPVAVDAEGSTNFVSATGHFVAPDQATTTAKVSLGGMVAEISVISLGDQQWGSNPLTGTFSELDQSYIYRPTAFLDPEEGFFPMLGSDLEDLTLVGEEELEELPGKKFQHLTGRLPGGALMEVSDGLIDVESMDVDLWLDPGSGEIHRVVLTDSSTADEDPSLWQFDFWGFGETTEITAP